ncbi:MAG: hypothetical protein ABS35_30370 [Kaistia sp. SCN 65-12]|nr:MAG: hypothetical protein ABS35_30370 [Kaistia sp. SCN 65-12]
MAITNYLQLQQAVSDWMARADVLGNAADFISLAEARLNRELNPVEVDAALTCPVGSRTVDISSLAMVEPIALYLKDTGGELRLLPRAEGTFPRLEAVGKPAIWAIDGDAIDFNRACDQNYEFRFRFKQKFALSDAVPTNWLLAEHPDVYLAASIMWGGVYTQDGSYAASFKSLLDETIPTIRTAIARKKRGDLTIYQALSSINHHRDGWIA